MDDKNFEDLYKVFYRDLVKVALNMVNSQEIAEEMAQEAFIRLYNRELNFDEIVEARYWLIRVVKNLSLNHIKRKKRERTYIKKAKREEVFFEETGESKVLIDESKSIVQESLELLPEKLREPLVLKEFGGLSYREIAQTLNISESNVKIRIFRARKLLAEEINEEDLYVSK
ncbi:MAG: RNA polymerase sigma factor [Spirochaetales bacterium]|nr:RNA polymerase sigma factor [Spirochaetales bacterium]